MRCRARCPPTRTRIETVLGRFPLESVEATGMSCIEITKDGPVARITMDRPDKHNAFNPVLIDELKEAFADLSNSDGCRVIVLAGSGRSFSAGADLDWMQAQGKVEYEENYRSSVRMGELFAAIDRCPKPVIARVQGAALGGGAGLVCSADIAVAGPRALFGFTEVRLGLVAAVISPHVLRRLGPSVAREKLLTGERFGAQEAYRIGLVHKVADDLDGAVDEVIDSILKGSSQGHAATKELLREMGDLPDSEKLAKAAEYIARARASSDGREGLDAFLNKRQPAWVNDHRR